MSTVKRPHNLSDLARGLGLSPTTVSRVLNGQADNYRISAQTRDRVLAAAQASAVVIDPIARGLRTRNTMTLGLLVPDIANPFFAQIASQVERIARTHGYSVLVANALESAEVESDSLRLMIGRRVDGLILAPVAAEPSALPVLHAAGIPCVVVDRVFEDPQLSSVNTANCDGAMAAVQHLIDLGHRAIACIQGLPGNHANDERLRGYCAALKQHGIRPKADWICGGNYTPQTGSHAVDQLFNGGKHQPTAILTLGNLIALGAMQNLRKRGLRLPTDVSLITFDDPPWAELLDPPLTTVSQPTDQISADAMRLLLAALADPQQPAQRVTLPLTLTQRASTAPPKNLIAAR